ncbi:MAG: hypothetical protein AAFZ18_05135 [Myxococcota bacterium]
MDRVRTSSGTLVAALVLFGGCRFLPPAGVERAQRETAAAQARARASAARRARLEDTLADPSAYRAKYRSELRAAKSEEPREPLGLLPLIDEDGLFGPTEADRLETWFAAKVSERTGRAVPAPPAVRSRLLDRIRVELERCMEPCALGTPDPPNTDEALALRVEDLGTGCKTIIELYLPAERSVGRTWSKSGSCELSSIMRHTDDLLRRGSAEGYL